MGSLIDQLIDPASLKKISIESLPELASEIREIIIDVVSKNGGHLSSNLGVVELTVALHYVFNTPIDKIIWDVGHQSYTHKLLTGRKKDIYTLRQYGGLSGFPRREESEYDSFNVGHGGTSISCALAFAKARDHKGLNNKVIAIIGDGSMTSGLALEGLNNAGDLETDLIVILNDNEMSISQNVGALSSYLNRIITGQLYNKMKTEIETLIQNIPGIGKQVVSFAERVEEAIKGIFVPGRIFEDLGFTYIGPIHGHNISELINTFNHVKDMKGQILVHVVTKKGKGYKPAEEGADFYHGVSAFDKKTGKLKKKNSIPTYTEVFGKTIVKLALIDEKILGITAAMTDGTGLNRFSERFPDRFYDVGMAEQHAVTFASGLALEGFKPIVAIYSTFLQRAYDQILHDVCMMKSPVIFAIDRAGIVGEDGVTHQGVFDITYLQSMPNMVLMAPKDENELQHMLYSATLYNMPVAVRYPRGNGIGVKLDDMMETISIGRGEILREGDDLTIVAIGSMVYPAMAVAERLASKEIEATIINARFIKPLDKMLILGSARKTGYLVTIEENVLSGGFGSAIMGLMEEEMVSDIIIKRIGIPDQFIGHGTPSILKKDLQLDVDGIFEQIYEFIINCIKHNRIKLLEENNAKEAIR